MPTPHFTRKRNHLPPQSYVGRQWYFITQCSGLGQLHFARSAVVALLLNLLRTQCLIHHFDVYAYCFMPNHLHLELVGLSDESNVIALLHDFKGIATSRVRTLGIRNLWQKSFYDHILSGDDDPKAVAWYIFNNPVRKRMVKEPGDWPYSGSWMFDWTRAVGPIQNYNPPWK